MQQIKNSARKHLQMTNKTWNLQMFSVTPIVPHS